MWIENKIEWGVVNGRGDFFFKSRRGELNRGGGELNKEGGIKWRGIKKKARGGN